jgi:hypothetical protein
MEITPLWRRDFLCLLLCDAACLPRRYAGSFAAVVVAAHEVAKRIEAAESGKVCTEPGQLHIRPLVAPLTSRENHANDVSHAHAYDTPI